MIWASLISLVIGLAFCAYGFAASMADDQQANIAGGHEFVVGLGFCGAAIVLFGIQLWKGLA